MDDNSQNQRDPLALLKDRWATMSDVGAAAAVLGWDRQTYLPEGGLAGRAEQLSTLSRLSHEMLVSEETGRLIEEAAQQSYEEGSDAAAIVRLARRDYERATKVPSRIVADLSRETTLSEAAWVRAREGSDWSVFEGHLSRVLELQREAAEHIGYEEHPYDAMLDAYEPGTKKDRVQKVFDELKAELVPMIRAISEAGDFEERTAPLRGGFDEGKQEEFGVGVVTDFGYDWKRGRLDRVVHPFCIPLGGPGDVRMTTRFDPEWLSPFLFGTLHECGHALYEQGVDPAYSRTPLAGGVSMGVHESQSRLWENLVGRSRGFWSHYYPRLQETFPEKLSGVGFEEFYRAINASSPSEIRVDADEVTYNLHILLRFELEVALMEGSLSVSDLPEAWNEKTREYLGLTPRDDARGVLQDIHWADGLLGYFPTYTLGNVLSVQLFEAAKGAHPHIEGEIERGEFGTLLGWLRENVHRPGSKYDPEDLVERATGRPVRTAPYLSYLKEKFGELYEMG